MVDAQSSGLRREPCMLASANAVSLWNLVESRTHAESERVSVAGEHTLLERHQEGDQRLLVFVG